MSSTSSQRQRVVLVDEEWAATLVGLPMAVPNSWWEGYKRDDDTLNAGTIVGVDFHQPNSKYFQLECGDEIYAMRYDAVYQYVDTDHASYDAAKFRLPLSAPANPEHERGVTIAPRKKKKQTILRDDEDDDDDEDEGSDDYFATPPKRSKPAVRKRKHNKRKATINPDLVFGAVANAGAGANDGIEASVDEDPTTTADPNRYTMTDKVDWTRRENGTGRIIEPVPYTGPSELFDIELEDGDLEKMKDAHGTIRFHLVFDWLLPKFGEGLDEDGFYEFVAARMRNYMIQIIRKHAFSPEYFDPYDEKIITADNVARFFGCQLVRAIKGLPSVRDCWSTRESLDAIGTAKESMPRAAFSDMQRCMHFADDWEEEDREVWGDNFVDKKFESPIDIANHRRKFGVVEDAFNARWKAAVIFGRRLTMDESRTPGWYHGPITQGPEPKPVRTGATMHTVCVTDGPLATYKLHARTFGGKTDEDLQSRHENVVTTQKWVNLMDIILDEFKGNGHCATMDSAYMGDVMAQIGREEWQLNMVGTSQSNRVGADVKDVVDKMKVGTYESIIWEHNTKNLVYAAWSDNAIVKTLSNYHGATILEAGDGMMRKGKDANKKREMVSKPVPCPAQTKTYCETFHLIDKGNGAEATYDMAGKSRSHNWAPKLVFRLFNMAMNNAYVMYKELVKRDGEEALSMGRAMKELAHGLCQQGESMRSNAVMHPSHLRDMSRVEGHEKGSKIRKDRKSEVMLSPLKNTAAISAKAQLNAAQKRQGWRKHQPMPTKERRRCCWARCPGIKNSKAKRKRAYDTSYHCEQCSVDAGHMIYLCHSVKKGEEVSCHVAYHKRNHNKRFPSDER